MSTHTTPTGPFGYCGPLNRAERHAPAEGARTAAMLARGADTAPMLDVRNDPAAGLAFVLDVIGSTTVVAIHPDHGSIGGRWLDASTQASVTAWAAEQSAAGFNLYFAVNLPTANMAKKPSRADITAIRGVFADVDAKAGRSLDQALTAVMVLPPPSLVIATGGGFQPLWMLDRPVLATEESMAEAEAVGRHIARLTDGDAVQNVDRILRLPFTVNYPNAKKRRAGRVTTCSGLVRGGAGR